MINLWRWKREVIFKLKSTMLWNWNFESEVKISFWLDSNAITKKLSTFSWNAYYYHYFAQLLGKITAEMLRAQFCNYRDFFFQIIACVWSINSKVWGLSSTSFLGFHLRLVFYILSDIIDNFFVIIVKRGSSRGLRERVTSYVVIVIFSMTPSLLSNNCYPFFPIYV